MPHIHDIKFVVEKDGEGYVKLVLWPSYNDVQNFSLVLREGITVGEAQDLASKINYNVHHLCLD